MTTELEKQFFKVFWIEPNIVGYELKQIKENVRGLVKEPIFKYPEITDRHYLELICILGYFEIVYKPDNCEELKKYILKYYLNLDDSEIRELKHQVQAIFEGER